MKNILLVPIQTDALFLSKDTLLTEASVDFSHLPYFNGTRDVNADVANISENIISQPLQDQNLRLRKGLHLHWALPDAMNRGRHLETGKTEFPTVPNRWIVTKEHNGSIVGSWVVESDYLFPEDKKLKNNETLRKERRESITVPVQIGGRESGEQPFRHMGRKLELAEYFNVVITRESFISQLPQLKKQVARDQWDRLFSFDVLTRTQSSENHQNTVSAIIHEEKLEDSPFKEAVNSDPILEAIEKVLRKTIELHENTEYFSELTAVGYGEPSFAAFYPNCRSVFGFHDPEMGLPEDPKEQRNLSAKEKEFRQSATYDIYGYFDNEDNDFLQNLTFQKVEITLAEFVQALPEISIEEAESVWEQLLNHCLDHQPFNETPIERAFIKPLFEWTMPSAITPGIRLGQLHLEGKMKQYINERTGWEFEEVVHEFSLAGAFKSEVFLDYWEKLLEAGWLRPVEGNPSLAFLPPASERTLEVMKNILPMSQGVFDRVVDIIRKQRPRQVVLHSRIEVDITGADGKVPQATQEGNKIKGLSVAIGKTGTEALSAYLANQLGTGDGATEVKEQLESLFLLDKLDLQMLDVEAKFDEAQHEKGFNALASGHLWTISIENKNSGAANAALEANKPKLSAELAKELNELNTLQWNYDRARDEWKSLGSQLFADWYKYMMSVYPPEDTRIDHPDIDEVRHFIETRVMEPLKEKAKATGELIFATPDEIRAGTNPAKDKDGLKKTLAGQVAKLLNSISTKLNTINANPDNQSVFVLQRIGGPRYYEPKEPVVLLVNNDEDNVDIQPTKRHGHDRSLLKNGQFRCLAFMQGQPDFEYLNDPQLLLAKLPKLDEVVDTTPGKLFGFSKWDGQPWNPFRLDWEIEIVPLANGANMQEEDYDPDFLRKTFSFEDEDGKEYKVTNFDLPINNPDLNPLDQTAAVLQGRNPNIYSGKSLLTPQAKRGLRERLEAYIADIDAADEAHKPPQYQAAVDALAVINQGKFHLLSQALSGFNSALLQLRQTFQLPIADPIGFLDYQPFTEEVAKLAKDSTRLAPQPLTDFNPIINGKLSINELWLMDTFGQKRKIDLDLLDRVVGADLIQAQSKKENTILEVALQPRLPQATRINFRWMNANEGTTEMNVLPDTSPICGWFLTNQLDDSLVVYDAAGLMLGSIEAEPDPQDDSKAKWNTTPGALDEILPEEIPNPFLQKVVNKILRGGVDFVAGFIDEINGVLSDIEPEEFESQQALSLLIGRPVALVRASINLETQGVPALDQAWNSFYLDREEGDFDRKRDGYTQVKFPVRLGKNDQFNDGLVGYWKEAFGELEEDFLINQTPTGQDRTGMRFLNDKEIRIEQSIDDAPQLVSMLIDPRGKVHVTTGILPVKDINIPTNQYLPAMQRMGVTFLTAPLLTPAINIQSLLPTEEGFDWSWVERAGSENWREVFPQPNIDRTLFLHAFADKMLAELEKYNWVGPMDGNIMEFLSDEFHQTEHFTELVDEELFGILEEISREETREDGSLILLFDAVRFKERIARLNDLGGKIWNLLVRSDVTWCQFIPDRPETFVILPHAERSSNELPEVGLENLVEEILKTYTQILSEPRVDAHFGPAEITIREGYLKLKTSK